MKWLLYTMYSRQDYQFCKQIIDKQLIESYDHEYLYYIKGLILRDEDKLNESIKCFQNAIQLNEKNHESYKELAKTYYKMGSMKQALDTFLKTETLMERPDYEVYHHIGELLLRNVGEPRAGLTEAKEYFKQAILCGKHPNTYKLMAEIFIKEKDHVKAIEMIENCLHISPDEDPALLTQIGILYIRVNENSRALERLLDAINIDEQNTKALLAYGSILQNRNDIDGAFSRYKCIPQIREKGVEIWSNIGMCYWKKQKYIAAISCLKKAAWMSPLNFNILYNLGLVLMTAQQYVSAFQIFAAATNLRPDNAECFMLIGICLKYVDDMKSALIAMEKSVLLPNAISNPIIYLNYSIFCYDINKFEQSRMYLTNFFSMAKNFKIRDEYIKIAEKLQSNMSLMEMKIETPDIGETNAISNSENDNSVSDVDKDIDAPVNTSAPGDTDVTAALPTLLRIEGGVEENKVSQDVENN